MHQPGCARRHSDSDPCASALVPLGDTGASAWLVYEPDPAVMFDFPDATEAGWEQARAFAQGLLDLTAVVPAPRPAT
jgi:hypothetical protein